MTSKGSPAVQKSAPLPVQKRTPPPRPQATQVATRRFFPEFKLDVDAVMRAYDNHPAEG